MANKNAIRILAFTAATAALLWLYLALAGWPLRIDTRPHEALGEVLAQEALKLLGGGRVILVARDTQAFPNPSVEAQQRRFLQVLAKAGAKVSATNTIKLDPLRPVGVPPGDFFLIIKKAAEADVVVSFVGPPALNPDQLSKLGDKRTDRKSVV